MQEACLFDVLELSTESLKRVLTQISSRSLVRLLRGYPRTVHPSFMALLNDSMSPATMMFLNEEIVKSESPTFEQIRGAESELINIVQLEKLFPSEKQLVHA